MAKTPAPADAGVVKRKPGRPPGTTKKSPSTAELKAAAVAAAAASGEPPRGRGRPKSINASSTSTTTKITAAEAAEAVAAAEKRKLDADGEEGAPRKRGRPAGTGKKQKAAAAAAAAVVKNSRVDNSMASDEDDDAADAFHGIKLTIERCTTCTQYHKNVVRIFDLARKLHPNALFQEDVVPNSKSFEIYVSSNGSKNKLIWSGKAHAPPKRLAFPDSDVFVNLLEEELKDK